MENRRTRVRFAPSPTGPLHMGGVRTALYNYLFARKHGGDFILRIEDTDQTRYVPGAEEYIMESLEWCGIRVDEGIREGGNYGPYRQSDRKSLYKQYADILVESGNAYYAFDTPGELEELRKRLETEKAPNTSYCAASRGNMKNSLTLSTQEVEEKIKAGESFVIRFKMPDTLDVQMRDLIRGDVNVNTSTLDDKVLFKSDGMPTYHLANVVDDHLMEITHVIRGEEWLPSMPLHVLLYRALGWEKTMPAFAHLPLLLKPDGKGKLSKRDGDRLGFPVFPIEWKDPSSGEISSGYRESGYFPGAFTNMIALLGWNPGIEQEIFTMDELVELFSIEKVGKSGSKFDNEKAKWFNHQYLSAQDNQQLAGMFMNVLKGHGLEPSIEFVERVCGVLKDRVNFVKDFWQHGQYFFVAPATYDQEVIRKRWKPETAELLLALSDELAAVVTLEATVVSECIHRFCDERQVGMGMVMNPLRLVLVGSASGPDLPLLIEMLGKKEVIARVKAGVERITPEN
jgi:glutamyl-tRNA synthetase